MFKFALFATAIAAVPVMAAGGVFLAPTSMLFGLALGIALVECAKKVSADTEKTERSAPQA